MKNTLLIIALAVVCFSGHAQIRKCTGPDGKVTYSDVLCAGTATREAAIETSANTIDHSGLRNEAQRMRETQDLADLTANTPRECRFKYYTYGDPKGKALSQKAKAECIQNLLAAKQGKPATREAYAMWKDHFDQTATSRRATVQQIAEAENTRRIVDSNEAAARKNEEAVRDAGRRIEQKLDQPMTCKKSALSSDLVCK